MELKRGDLIRWVIDHEVYEADVDVLRGIQPNYRHGIVMEISTKDANAVVVYCYDCKKKWEGDWMILNLKQEEFEVLSGTPSG